MLLNLESCGAIAVTGDLDSRASLVNSIALELAASAFSDAPTVLTVRMASMPSAPEHARAVCVEEALGWMRDRNDSATALLAHRRLTSLFALRARSRPQESHEPVIVIVDPSDVDEALLAEMIELSNGDLGTVLVVTGPCSSLTWQLECAGGVVTVQPLALAMDSVGVSEDIDCLIEEFVPPAEPDQDELQAGEELDADEVSAVLADHVAIAQERLPSTTSATAVDGSEWDVELKVLGQVRCVGSKEPLTRPNSTSRSISPSIGTARTRTRSPPWCGPTVLPSGRSPTRWRRFVESSALDPTARCSSRSAATASTSTSSLHGLPPIGIASSPSRGKRRSRLPTKRLIIWIRRSSWSTAHRSERRRATRGHTAMARRVSICETVTLVARRRVDLHLEREEFLDAGTAETLVRLLRESHNLLDW